MTNLRIHPLLVLAIALAMALPVRAAAAPTIYKCALSQPACRAGYGVVAAFAWEAQPVPEGEKVFVHVRNAAGQVVFQLDHDLPAPASKWTGRVTYDMLITAPPELPTGEYAVVAGLWNPKDRSRLPLTAGDGVIDRGESAYQVATFQVSPEAPLPTLAAPTLDLSRFRLTFAEEFTGPLSVSARGPGTRWTAHMPDAPDFGDGKFADPDPDFPFTIENGVLRIEARKKDGQWQSGLLASIDKEGHGFSQQYGYFEMRAKFPKGEGVWPAFWLMKPPTANDQAITRVEIDIVEQFGARPNTLSSSFHFWGPGKEHRILAHGASVQGMTDDFHRYGVLIEPEFTTFYFDGAEHWRIPTPEEAKVPLYVLVDLALGSGWPTSRTPEPSHLQIDHVRVYEGK